jgi:hypothetical protein
MTEKFSNPSDFMLLLNAGTEMQCKNDRRENFVFNTVNYVNVSQKAQ